MSRPVTRAATSVEVWVLPPQDLVFSPKRPGRLAGACCTGPDTPRPRGSEGTEISLSQKQQIQQLRLLQETQICTGLISLGLYRHPKSRSYYTLSGGQGLTSSGVGEMIPSLQSGPTPPRSLTRLGPSWPCPGKAVSSQDRPLPGHPDPQEPSPLENPSQRPTPQGRLGQGTRGLPEL